DQEAFGRCIIPGHVFDKIDGCPKTYAFTKHILYHLYDDAVRKTQDEALVNDPHLKGMSKELSPKLFNPPWIMVFIAFGAVAFSADILGDRLATPALGEMEIDERVLRHLIAHKEGVAFMLRADSTWRNPYNFPYTCWEKALIRLVAFFGSTFLRL